MRAAFPPSAPCHFSGSCGILDSDRPGLEFDAPSLSFLMCEMGTPPL